MTSHTSRSVPILREDDTSLDWPDAAYEARVVMGGGHGRVEHRLARADQLADLVTDGKAEWVVEVRSPATLYAGMAGSSRERKFAFYWDSDAVTSGSYVIPGMVTTQEVDLDTGSLHAVWGKNPIVVPPGRWLVRGNARNAEQLGSSLIRLFPDEDLADGRMTVTPFTGEGDLRFHVKMSPRMFETRAQDRDVQISALIAAFGRIPGVVGPAQDAASDEPGEAAQYPVLERIRSVLEDADVADWTDPSEYDPARAATAVERFVLPEENPEADDE